MENISKREEIEMLLPLYVTGTLSSEEQVMVEAYLQENPDIEPQLDLIQQEREASIAIHEELGTLPSGALNKLHEKLDVLEQQHSTMRTGSSHSVRTNSLLQSLKTFFLELTDFNTNLGKIAVAAAVLVIIVQTSIIGSFMTAPSRSGSFETASRTETATNITAGTSLLIAFTETSTTQDIVSLITEFRGTIISGPTEDGFFTVRISETPLSDEKIEQIIKDLEGRDATVSFVAQNEP